MGLEKANKYMIGKEKESTQLSNKGEFGKEGNNEDL